LDEQANDILQPSSTSPNVEPEPALSKSLKIDNKVLSVGFTDKRPCPDRYTAAGGGGGGGGGFIYPDLSPWGICRLPQLGLSLYHNYVFSATCRRIWSLVRAYVDLIALELRLARRLEHGFETAVMLPRNPVLR
jgi:hypothetical protein